jgi:hypothetical protein
VSTTPVANISANFRKKIRNIPNDILGGLEELIHEKNRSRKSRGTVSLSKIEAILKSKTPTCPIKEMKIQTYLTTTDGVIFKGTIAPDQIGLKVVWLDTLI